jgi:hypothetical protein
VLDGPCGDPQMTQSKMLHPLLKKILNTCVRSAVCLCLYRLILHWS